MRKIIAVILTLGLTVGLFPWHAPVYGETFGVSSRDQLIKQIQEQVSQHAEQIKIHYRGQQDLSKDNFLNEIMAFDGTEESTMLQSIYGLEALGSRYSYVTGKDIQYTISAEYRNSLTDMAQLDKDLQGWVDTNLSPAMYSSVKAAIITKYLSERLQYQLGDNLNNAYAGFYNRKTACSGYAELSWHLLRKTGIPVKMISGYTPDNLTDTEFSALNLSSSDMIALANQNTASDQTDLHVWNMVQIDGSWYHLDNTWADEDRNNVSGSSALSAQYFLGSDEEFRRHHGWVRQEYPASPGNWWEGGADEVRQFLKAYLNTRIYDYPKVTSLEQLNAFAEEAYRSGRGSQVFRISQGVQAYDVYPTLGSVQSKVPNSLSEYRVAPQNPGDGYLLTLEFKGRDSKAVENLPAMVKSINITRGESLSPMLLLENPERSEGPPVKWISLTPGLLQVAGESFEALKEGRGFVGAYTRDKAVIIPVIIEAPKLQVFLNGAPLGLDPKPMILEGRTLVPLRGIFEAMGATVVYDAEKRTITGTRGTQTLFLTLGSKNAQINGQEVVLDVPPQILNNRSFVPARLIAESFGATVQWDAIRNRVLITDSAP